jgi:hypothetical protein
LANTIAYPIYNMRTISKFFFLIALLSFYACKKYNVEHFGCQSPAVDDSFPGGYVFMPNIFTPNGDGQNDNLAIASHGATNISLEIKENGCIVVFKDDSMEFPGHYWDGDVRNHLVVNGRKLEMYHYILSYTLPTGERKTVKGKIACDPLNGNQLKNYLSIGCIEHLDQCEFSCQWDGTMFNPLLPTNEYMGGPCNHP